MTQPSGWQPDEQTREEALGHAKLADLARTLIADIRALVAAESARQRLRAGLVASGVKIMAIAGVVAIILLFATLIALIIGLIWALAPLVGPWVALALVIGGALIVIGILALVIVAQVKRIKRGWNA